MKVSGLGSLSLAALLLLSGCGGGSSSSGGSGVSDPLFVDQWHLDNTGQFSGTTVGEDINVAGAWAEDIKGRGVLVAVVDDGLQLAHEDLSANIAAKKSWDYDQQDTDPSPQSRNYHGTGVAGLIAARDENGVGLRGVAPRASLAGYNLLWQEGTVLTSQIFDAMTRNVVEVAVSNNSWGLATDGLGEAEPPVDGLWQQAVAQGVDQGRGGRGTIYVWAAGNGAGGGGQDNSNYDYQANNRHVITVCALDGRGRRASYSEPGANLWVCAPGGDNLTVSGRAYSLGLVTTDLMGAAGCNGNPDCQVAGDYVDQSYTRAFLGSSAATPLVSGVVALMLEANPALGWRDVRLILAETARRNHPAHGDWALTSPAVGQPQYHINHDYGFGVVDAAAAVARAKTWVNVGPQRVIEKTVNTLRNIPDGDLRGVTEALTLDAVADGDLIIEYVEVDFTSNHFYPGDLEIVLTAPSGTRSVLAETHSCLIDVNGSYQTRFGTCLYRYDPWTFGSSRHLGERSSGTWQLTVADKDNPDVTGQLLSWTLRIYGRES